MAWTALNALVLTQSGAYSPLPVSAAGGEINVRIPAFALGQVGTYRIGIYSGGAGAPGLVASRDYALAPFERYLSFDIPANTNSPLLGIQLISHAELQTASFNVVPEWQPVEFSGQFPGNGHLPLALTLDYVIGLVSGAIANAYATYAELEELTGGIEAAINAISLLQGPQGEPGIQGEPGPQGDPGIPGELPIEALNIAIANLRSELEMIGEPFQHSGGVGVAGSVVLPPPPPGFKNVILSVDFSYGGPQAQLNGVFSITESNGEVVRHRSAVTSTGTGPFFKGIRCGEAQAVTITLSALAGYTANVNGSFRVEAI